MLTESTWPQPHEKVSGIHRTRDDLLSLEGPALRRRVVMMTIANSLWKATLGVAHTEFGREEYKRMNKPRMGDLVVETMSMRNPDVMDADSEQRSIHGFGILLGEREEWTCSHEDWARYVEEAAADGDTMTLKDRATVKALYVQYGPQADDIVRWTNCSFIALPTGLLYHTKEMNPPQG